MDKKTIKEASFWLVIFGAIDMGLYALFGGDYDIINFFFRDDLVIIAQIIETLIGAAGVYLLYLHLSGKKSEKI